MIGMFGKRRPKDVPRKPVRALILGGGGARGAYEAGVVAALAEHETFDVVCGTSIGAINGMFVAQNTPERLIDVWRTISTRGITQLKPELATLLLLWQATNGLMRSPFSQKAAHAVTMMRMLPRLAIAARVPSLLGCFESGNVRSIIRELADFSAVKRTFICGATNLTNGRPEAFAYFPPGHEQAETAFHAAEWAEPIHAGNYVDAICASAALPPVYEPVSILCKDAVTRSYADGGFTNNAPIRQAIDAGATEVTAILADPSGIQPDERSVGSIVDIFATMLDANTVRMLELDLKLARRINEAVLAGRAPDKRYVTIRVIEPRTSLRLSALAFDAQDDVNRLFDLGYEDGRAARVA
jgi:predicted acylesterase/phospholipase RssA